MLLEYILWFLAGSLCPDLKVLFDDSCEVKGKHGKPKNICTKYWRWKSQIVCPRIEGDSY